MALSNVHSVAKSLGTPLETYTLPWDEMRDLQLAYLRAGVINQDVPQDHAFLAALYRMAAKYRLKYILSGGNYATESILPKAWVYNALDLRNIEAIHREHGARDLVNYPTMNFLSYYLIYPYLRRIRVLRPLDSLPYDTSVARESLKKIGWREYGSKHHESLFTKFYQVYYLPNRYGILKKRAHLSSLVVSGQIIRQQALEEIEKKDQDAEIQETVAAVAERLGLSLAELQELMDVPRRSHLDYPSQARLYQAKDKIAFTLRNMGFLRNRQTYPLSVRRSD